MDIVLPTISQYILKKNDNVLDKLDVEFRINL